jgi:pyruvate ferredoxin oxidoreductase alpha subunit
MARKVIEASEAVALGVKLSRPSVIPMYPITPQTHIVERLAEYINDGDLDSGMIHVESEHSAMSAAVGAQATGVRTFTATASQGLALMNEILFIASGMRLPIVMAIANRALSAPINIWNDHSDSFAARDSGWIQIYAESAQEALDASIQAYMIAEDHAVLLPVMVCIDGFTLSHVYEPVDVPEQEMVDKLLKPYKATHAYLDPKNPITQGPIGFPNAYMELKYAQHEAMLNSKNVIQEANWIYAERLGRGYGDGLVEPYKLEDAEYAIIGLGSVCGTMRVVVDELRKAGKKVGMLKVRTFRPFPTEQVKKALSTLKGVAIIDKEISFGQEGTLYSEIRSAVYDQKSLIINGFIAGLGGRDITPDHLKKAFDSLSSQKKPEWLG